MEKSKTVWITTGRGSNGHRTLHYDEDCHLLNRGKGKRPVTPSQYPHGEACSKCGPSGHLNGVMGTPNGLCPSCHGRLDERAICPWCEKFEKIFGNG